MINRAYDQTIVLTLIIDVRTYCTFNYYPNIKSAYSGYIHFRSMLHSPVLQDLINYANF